MAKKIVALLLSFCLMLMASCQKKPAAPISSKPKIVSTTAMINELVKEIAGDKFEAESLIKGDIDPHSYELVKGDQTKLKTASCIFYQGLGLEHGASLVAYLQTDKKAIAVGDVLKQTHADDLIYHDDYLDPHVWLDLHLWEQIVPVITNKLIELQPENQVVLKQMLKP